MCDGADNDCNGLIDEPSRFQPLCWEEGGYTCAAGGCQCLVMCEDSCVAAQTDDENCGACDHGCPLGGSCAAGTCTCPVGKVLCGGICADQAAQTASCGEPGPNLRGYWTGMLTETVGCPNEGPLSGPAETNEIFRLNEDGTVGLQFDGWSASAALSGNVLTMLASTGPNVNGRTLSFFAGGTLTFSGKTAAVSVNGSILYDNFRGTLQSVTCSISWRGTLAKQPW